MTMLYIKYTSYVPCSCREDCFLYFHYKSMVDNDMPGAWPVWTPGAPLATFIKESIIHWSTQHMKALGHMVSEKKIFLWFSHDAPGVGPAWTPGAWLAGFVAGFINRTTLHCYTQKYESFGPCGYTEEDFLKFFPWTPGARLAVFIMRTTIHCYKKNMNLWALWLRRRGFFKVFPMTPPRRGLYGPEGHGWQDLQRGPLFIATNKI